MHKQKIFIFIIIMGFLCSCGLNFDADETGQNLVQIEVISSFTSPKFTDAYLEWEKINDNRFKIINQSVPFDEANKNKILRDFETSSEPDVLFFFNGADANPFIEAGRVVSIPEIRKHYPDYAMNMDDEKIAVSLVDGIAYAVPIFGFWEALYVNTEVLAAAGVAVPADDYTWEQFLDDCEAIKMAGYIPIAAALGHVPHYWWEYMIFNHTTIDTHLDIPADIDDVQGKAWRRGMEDIQFLYDAAFFPPNTLTMIDDESFALFVGGEAAFLLDGSWRATGIVNAFSEIIGDMTTLDEEMLEKIDVVFVPTRGKRQITDMIGGMSSGYYITRKAWDDPVKRDAAVSFVMHMISNENVHMFAEHTANALKDGQPDATHELTSLQLKAIDLVGRSTSYTGAVQDILQGKSREPLFDGLPDILVGDTSIESAIAASLKIYAQTKEMAE